MDDDLKTLLRCAGITKAELARRLGMNPRTISTWGNKAPGYAAAYLKLTAAYNRIAPMPYSNTE